MLLENFPHSAEIADGTAETVQSVYDDTVDRFLRDIFHHRDICGALQIADVYKRQDFRCSDA